jgi:hypothetical protein
MAFLLITHHIRHLFSNTCRLLTIYSPCTTGFVTLFHQHRQRKSRRGVVTVIHEKTYAFILFISNSCDHASTKNDRLTHW